MTLFLLDSLLGPGPPVVCTSPHLISRFSCEGYGKHSIPLSSHWVEELGLSVIFGNSKVTLLLVHSGNKSTACHCLSTPSETLAILQCCTAPTVQRVLGPLQPSSRREAEADFLVGKSSRALRRWPFPNHFAGVLIHGPAESSPQRPEAVAFLPTMILSEREK